MMLTRRSFFKLAGTAVFGTAALSLSGCGEPRGEAASSNASSSGESNEASSKDTRKESTTPSPSSSSTSSDASGDALVVYFSHAGENYGVGYIEEGNTAVVAKMIAEGTGADLFEVVPVEAYPEGYDECCDVALTEKNEGARPAYAGDIDIASYKTVYLGYPIWWGDLPMCMYTFLEAHGWEDKDIRPFCTHAGSGLANTAASIQETCAGASVGQGLSIAGTTAQDARDEARTTVDSWLA